MTTSDQITVCFLQGEQRRFMERIIYKRNLRAIKFMGAQDKRLGFSCGRCERVLPAYHYRDSSAHKHGVDFAACKECCRDHSYMFLLAEGEADKEYYNSVRRKINANYARLVLQQRGALWCTKHDRFCTHCSENNVVLNDDNKL